MQKTANTNFRINLPVNEVCKLLTAHYIAEVNFRHNVYVDDDYTRKVLHQIAEILVSPTSKFGIALAGTCGNGKTTLVYAIQGLINWLNNSNHFFFMGEYFHAGMQIYDAKELITASKDFNLWRKICLRDMLAIDDLGKEPTEVLDYGNTFSPLVDLLEKRYQKQKFTVVTTNLTPKDMSAKYGERLADRFREMFELLIFDFPSFRGKTSRL